MNYSHSVFTRLSNTMNSIVVYLVILAVVAGASSEANVTVSSATDDYVALWDRKFQNDIRAADMKIECMDARGADSIRVIKDQHEEILKEIKRYDDSLVPGEALSLIRKHCIQKNKGMLVSVTTATSLYQTCIAQAQSRVNSLTAGAKTNVAAAKTAANINLPRALVSCNTTYYTNPVKKEECIVNNVDIYQTQIQTNLRAVDKNLDASLCSVTDLSRDAIQCSFTHERNILVTIGKVTSLIDTCMHETEAVCPCAKDLMVESETPSSVRRLLLPTNTTRT